MSVGKILVPIDFSDRSQKVLDFAIEHARAFDATLHLVHVFEVLVYRGVRYDEVLSSETVEETEERCRKSLAEHLEHATGQGVKGESHLVEGEARDVIARVAKELEIDLIILGSHGRSRLKHLLLGSVAEHTLRFAPCAVLVVKG